MKEYELNIGRSHLRLIGQSCMDGLRELEASSVDVVVTSPPYNIGIEYGTYEDTAPRESYLAWLDAWADEVRRVLKEDGSLFFNVGSKPTDPWVPLQAAAAVAGGEDIRRLHTVERFVLQNTFHWVKSIAIDKDNVGESVGLSEDLAVGHYKPINSSRFVNDCHEFVFHFTLTGNVKIDRLSLGVPYADKSNISRWKTGGRDRRCRGNQWFVPYNTIKNRASDRPHPAAFPAQLAEWCLRLHGAEAGAVVVDPFMGLGSTAVAVSRVGASFIGYEIDASYLRVACETLRSLETDSRQQRLY